MNFIAADFHVKKTTTKYPAHMFVLTNLPNRVA